MVESIETHGLPPLVPDSGFWSVAIYLANRRYGGPEEGGWWYDCGKRVDDPEMWAEIGQQPRTFAVHAEALAFRDALEESLREFNVGRRSKHSVKSTGVYEAEIHDGWPPARYPDARPHYE